MRMVTEGKVSDYLTNLKNKAVATYDYYMGNRTNKLGNLEDATAKEIHANTDLLKIVQIFNNADAPYKVQADRTANKLLMQFNASHTPKELVDAFDERRKGKYVKYIDNYDNNSGVVDLIFDADLSEINDNPNIGGVKGKYSDVGQGTSNVVQSYKTSVTKTKGESVKLSESFILVPDAQEASDIIDVLGFNGSLEVEYDAERGPAIVGDNVTLSQFIKEYNEQIGEFDLKIEESIWQDKDGDFHIEVGDDLKNPDLYKDNKKESTDTDIKESAPQIGDPDPAPNTMSIVDLIKSAYDKGLFNSLKCVGRENACDIDLSGVDKDRLISFFDSKKEFNREDHNESGVNSVEFISDKFDIEIFDSFMRVYKIPQDESLKESSDINDKDLEVIKVIDDVNQELGKLDKEEISKRLKDQGISVEDSYLDDMLKKSQEMLDKGIEESVSNSSDSKDDESVISKEDSDKMYNSGEENNFRVIDRGIDWTWFSTSTYEDAEKWFKELTGSAPKYDWVIQYEKDTNDGPHRYSFRLRTDIIENKREEVNESVQEYCAKYNNGHPMLPVGTPVTVDKNSLSCSALTGVIKEHYYDPPRYLVEWKDSWEFLDSVHEVSQDLEQNLEDKHEESVSGSATQSSSLGQHKRASIDIVPDVSNKDAEELKKALEQS